MSSFVPCPSPHHSAPQVRAFSFVLRTTGLPQNTSRACNRNTTPAAVHCSNKKGLQVYCHCKQQIKGQNYHEKPVGSHAIEQLRALRLCEIARTFCVIQNRLGNRILLFGLQICIGSREIGMVAQMGQVHHHTLFHTRDVRSEVSTQRDSPLSDSASSLQWEAVSPLVPTPRCQKGYHHYFKPSMNDWRFLLKPE